MGWNAALFMATSQAPGVSGTQEMGKNTCCLYMCISKRRNSSALNSNRKQVRGRDGWRGGGKSRKMSQVCGADSVCTAARRLTVTVPHPCDRPHHHVLLISEPKMRHQEELQRQFKTAGKDESLGKVLLKGACENVFGVRGVNWS